MINQSISLILFAAGLLAQSNPPYKPGDFQSSNPNYPVRNPFYFEGRVDWNLLKITVPNNAWEFAQRGIYKQDDLEDIPGAIADYRASLSMNSLANGSCQLITAVPAANFGQTSPPPCMFTVRLRLGYLLRESSPDEAIGLFQEVLLIDPLRLGVNALIGETYELIGETAGDSAARANALGKAVAAFQAELALSPVTDQYTQLTGDRANNAHVHWSLARVFSELGQTDKAASELDLYLKASQWHSDTYPWRIDLAKKRLGN